MIELHMKGTAAALMQPGNIHTKWPEVVRLGDGSLWLPGRFTKPKGGGDKARLYYMAEPLDLPQIMAPDRAALGAARVKPK